jgi:ABC-2 type transport system ATP-binding protein
MSAIEAAVRFERIVKRYGRTLALDEVTFDVGAGEFFALLGPNGAGKTTLLHILCTILRPDSGVAILRGANVVRDARRARQNLGVVFQESSLDDRLTVYENLEFHGLVYGVPTTLRRKRITQLLEVVELSERRDTVAQDLSSGMKRRLEIARALIHDSRVLILDEPTVGLDAQSREAIWQHVEQIRSERELTVIVTTHYVEEAESCARVCIIDGGKVMALDTPANLKARHGNESLRLVPRDAAARRELLARYPDRAVEHGEAITFSVPDTGFVDALLGQYGTRLKELSFEHSSLEGAFLALTGHGLKDQLAGARERTLAFGRRGGEHTR